MPSESSATIGEYLQTPTGKRNGVLAIGIFVIGLMVFDAYGFGADFLLFVFFALCATAAFATLWREAIICFIVGYIFWQYVIIALWWDIEYLAFLPPVAGVVLIVIAFGFLFADVFSPHKTQPLPGDSPSLYERIIFPGRRLRQLVSSVLPLSDLDSVPTFFTSETPQRAAGHPTFAPDYVFDASVQNESESEPALESPEQPEAPKRKEKRFVTGAPIAGSGLYIYTFILEFVGAVARSIVIAFIATVVLSPLYVFMFATTTGIYSDPGEWLGSNATISLVISAIIGVGLGFQPLVNSLFHVLFPFLRSGSGPTERDTLGAREPTREEMETIIDTVQMIQETSGKTIKKGAPSEWLVLDEPFPDAYTIGSTVYLTRSAIENDNLAGIMAHEMGHIAHKDGDLLLSLRRFIVPLAYWVGIDRQATAAGAVLGTGSTARLGRTQTEDEKIFFRFQALKIKLWLAFWFGGLGLLLLGRSWAQFWRQRDFLADDYAVKLGQADSLMGILEIYRHIDVAQPYLLTNRPYTAERLDRLKG